MAAAFWFWPVQIIKINFLGKSLPVPRIYITSPHINTKTEKMDTFEKASTITLQAAAVEAFDNRSRGDGLTAWWIFTKGLSKRQVYEAVEGITSHCSTASGSTQWTAANVLNLLEDITRG